MIESRNSSITPSICSLVTLPLPPPLLPPLFLHQMKMMMKRRVHLRPLPPQRGQKWKRRKERQQVKIVPSIIEHALHL